MARISERRPGREDGGFTRTFGDAGLGALLSMTHATSISAGTELEKQIQSLHANLMTAEQLGQFLKNALPNGKYVMAKDLIRKHLKPIINSSHEPDFIVIVVDGEKVFVVEVKDGDAFDTKKAAGEVASVRAFAASLHSFLLGINLAYSVEAKICCFNQEDKDRIVAGLKGRITRREAMTGREFCALIGISYDTIRRQRETDQLCNLDFFVASMLEIPAVRARVLSRLQAAADPAKATG